MDFNKKCDIIGYFIFSSAILNFVGHFGFWLESVLHREQFNPAVPNSTPFLLQTHRFQDISVSSFKMQFLSMEFPQVLGKRLTKGDLTVP